ncbi:CHASE2 domain-containing protein [Pantanalinema rosaneae CENA516]|uniref:CHASE2 domain-containing protein n=1 Tax=Pantanalinema rosaneae TaxID=1620701 RepID=UPI003D6EABA9
MIAQVLRQTLSRWQKGSLSGVSIDIKTIVLAGVGIVGILLGIRHIGGLEGSELAIYDQMVRLRSDAPPDPRLLIVTITDADIRAKRRWPLSDRTLAKVLKQLQQYQPRAIGLDLFRDIPNEPGYAELVPELKRPNVIAINYIGNTSEDAIPGPPVMPKLQIGFSEVVTDPDGKIRRNLMFASDGQETLTSFSLRLAMLYLRDPGRVTPNDQLQLGNTVFPRLRSHSGGYQTIDDRGYQILLNYRSGGSPAQTVTLTQVLNGDFQPEWVQDRIVLIGVTAISLKDLFFTPYSAAATENRTMPGVMIHAQQVSQVLAAVLDQRPLFRFWSEGAEILWIIGWAAIGGGIAWRVRYPVVLIVLEGSLLLMLFGVGFYLFNHQIWIPIATPAVAAIATGSFTIAYQMQQAHQQRQIVMKLLGQQTSPEVAAALWNSRDRLLQSGMLAGQSLTVTVMFADIKSFSTISEQRSPDQVLHWLNEYMRTMTQTVRTYDGIINKFLGDGLMAVFGVPLPRTTWAEVAADAQRAVACAVTMGDRLQALNRDWQERGLPVVSMRVGIFTGPVMAGSLGGKDRLEYAVIGDSVNIASRLESCEKDRQPDHCRILIARQTLEYLADRFQVESWGSLQLRGKQRTVEVYRVLGQNE